MNILFLNLPYKQRIQRRYICAFNAEGFLLPPMELLFLASAQKDKNQGKVILHDAIGEDTDYEKIKDIIIENEINVIVSLAGFESIGYELDFLNKIKDEFEFIKVILFGHYPTIFYDKIFRKSQIDIILLNEPDETFSELSNNNFEPKDIKGLAYQSNSNIVYNGIRDRIKDLDNLPIPDHSLLNINLYSEPFFAKPYSSVMTTRGCPFNCKYCVKTFSKEYYSRSPENVFEELKQLDSLGIHNFRIVDDIFTLNKKNVIELCKKIIDSNIKFKWTCLSRLDTIDDEMLDYMKKAGCKRIFLGVESGSQRILDMYNKGYNLSKVVPKFKRLKKHNIEFAGYFMTGFPEESREDLNQSIRLAKELDLDYIMVTHLYYYPGTKSFEENLNKVEFLLYPYKYKNSHLLNEAECVGREKLFYRKFFLRVGYLKKGLKIFIKHPYEVFKNMISLLSYIYNKQKEGDRPDFI